MTYARYILETGAELTIWEAAFGHYLYRSRFHQRSPILDVGPGRCWFVRQAAQDIVGVEIEPDLVEHYSREGLRIVVGSANAIPFADGTIDGIFCCWLCEHLADPAGALAEFSRVLRTDGYGCVIVPSVRTLLRGFYDDYTHIRPFTTAALGHMAAASGFTRFTVNPLFCTTATGRLSRHLGADQLERVFAFSDRYLRPLGLVNRNNLVLEVWKGGG